MRELCQSNKEVIWAIEMNNQNLNFNDGALQPKWTPLFKRICSRLIPTTHTSQITLDRAILLYAMIEKRKVDAAWIIYNIIDLVKPSMGLSFPALITKLCINVRIEVTKNEEKLKVGLAIFAKAST